MRRPHRVRQSMHHTISELWQQVGMHVHVQMHMQRHVHTGVRGPCMPA